LRVTGEQSAAGVGPAGSSRTAQANGGFGGRTQPELIQSVAWPRHFSASTPITQRTRSAPPADEPRPELPLPTQQGGTASGVSSAGGTEQQQPSALPQQQGRPRAGAGPRSGWEAGRGEAVTGKPMAAAR
jgi:hypothetical protein